MQTVFTRIQVTRKYLVVQFSLRGSVVCHKHVVRVPWRALNESYEMVVSAMEGEALAELRKRQEPTLFPLEAWE